MSGSFPAASNTSSRTAFPSGSAVAPPPARTSWTGATLRTMRYAATTPTGSLNRSNREIWTRRRRWLFIASIRGYNESDRREDAERRMLKRIALPVLLSAHILALPLSRRPQPPPRSSTCPAYPAVGLLVTIGRSVDGSSVQEKIGRSVRISLVPPLMDRGKSNHHQINRREAEAT